MLIILLHFALMLIHFVLVLNFAAIVIIFCVSITFCGDYYILRRNSDRLHFRRNKQHAVELTPRINTGKSVCLPRSLNA